MITSTGWWEECFLQPVPCSSSQLLWKVGASRFFFAHSQWTPGVVLVEFPGALLRKASIWSLLLLLICPCFGSTLLTSLSSRSWLGTLSVFLPLPATVSLHSSFPFQPSLLKKDLGNKRVWGCVCTCACYLIMSLVLRKKSLGDQSQMKDLDFSWRGKGGAKNQLAWKFS